MFLTKPRNKELFLVEGKHKKSGKPALPSRNQIINFESAANYGCNCIACREISLKLYHQQQQQQIRMTNESWFFRQQQMTKHASNLFQNKYQSGNYCELNEGMKRARLSTQNFQLQSSLAAVKAPRVYNFHQQKVLNTISAQAKYQPHDRLKNFHNRYFPGFYQPNFAFDSLFALQSGSHGSLTSSVGSDNGDAVTSQQQFGNSFVSSQHLQFTNNLDFYNFVN